MQHIGSASSSWEWLSGLFSRLRIAVIYAASPDAEGVVLHRTHQTRSWKSYLLAATDVRDGLKKLGFEHVLLLEDGMQLPRQLSRRRIHLAWLNTGGIQGYGAMSHAPALMEMLGVCYVGHAPLHAGVLDNKLAFKRQLMSLGVRTPPFVVWGGAAGPAPATVTPPFEGPYVVKPVSGRASLDVHFVADAGELAAVAAQVYSRTRDEVLIEQYLPGREYCVSVMGGTRSAGRQLVRHEGPQAFSATERHLGQDERIFSSMDVVGLAPSRARLLGPEDGARREELLALGRRIYAQLGIGSLIRLDVREDAHGELQVLEANPKPDLKRPSPDHVNLVCLGLHELGMDYEDLLASLLVERLELLLQRQAPLPPFIRPAP